MKPVVEVVLSAPANDLDGVTTELPAGLVLVDTRLVGQEVLIDDEGTCDWAVLCDVSLELFHAPGAVPGMGSLDLVRGVLELGVASAGMGALRGDPLLPH